MWRFRRALAAADAARDDASRIAALTRAVAEYRGELCAGLPFDWLEAPASRLHYQALDALAQLADLHGEDEPGQAVALLNRSLELDPYQEGTYQHLMRVHAAAGHPDAVHRTYSRLRRYLTEMRETPTPATVALLARLTRPPHDGPASRAPRP
ncbi:MAG: AfsR/SARP family transcriptional regulator [Frankia sp.]